MASAERIGGRNAPRAKRARAELRALESEQRAYLAQVRKLDAKMGQDDDGWPVARRLGLLCARSLLDVGVTPEDVADAGYADNVVAALREVATNLPAKVVMSAERAARLDRDSVTGGQLTGAELAKRGASTPAKT